MTVIVTTFSPLAQVADDPFSTTSSPTSITITADGSVVVAVILLVALVVDVVYSVSSGSNSGLNSKLPIVSADSLLLTTLFL